MKPGLCRVFSLAVVSIFCAGHATFAAAAPEMKVGTPEFKSMGPIAFGPDGILFVADTKSAAITAIAMNGGGGDGKGNGRSAPLKVEGVNQKIAALLGTSADQILINDLAVDPASKDVYLAVSRGRGPEDPSVLLRVNNAGKLEQVPLENVKFSRAELPDAPIDGVQSQSRRRSNPRMESITDIAFFQDRVLVAGLSNEEFASTFRAIPFPFKPIEGGTSVEIYHGAHGRFETSSPVRTFVPFNIGNEPHLLAAYTCTPLVQFPLHDLKPGAKIKGKTIAELGNRNRPLDMIVYQKDGKDYLLIANSSRGIMKLDASQIEDAGHITEKVDGTKGVGYQTIEQWSGIDQLDKLDAEHAVVLRRDDQGAVSIESLDLP